MEIYPKEPDGSTLNQRMYLYDLRTALGLPVAGIRDYDKDTASKEIATLQEKAKEKLRVNEFDLSSESNSIRL